MSGSVGLIRELRLHLVVRPEARPPKVSVTPVRRTSSSFISGTSRSLLFKVRETTVHITPAHRSALSQDAEYDGYVESPIY